MDIELEKKLEEIKQYISQTADKALAQQITDPIAKMMLVALLHETQKILDYIDSIGAKITEKFCEDFIPRKEIGAMPAIALVSPIFKKGKKTETISVENNTIFTFKPNDCQIPINYIPILKNTLFPYEDIYTLTPSQLNINNQNNVLLIGIHTNAELYSLYGLTLFIQGINGITPNNISIINNTECNLSFCTFNRIEDMEFLEPFDSQQSSGTIYSFLNHWKDLIINYSEGTFLCITDNKHNRDNLKKNYSQKVLQNILNESTRENIDKDTLWLQIEYPSRYIVPDTCTVTINVIPIVNIDVDYVILTQTNPIAKLQKNNNSYFVQVLETPNVQQKEGYPKSSDEFLIRDFDASCYHNGDLYRDIRNLYYHFVEDYYAFMNYNGLKEGTDCEHLRELINRLSKNVGSQNAKYKFDSGTYAMKNISTANAHSSTVTKVQYITTMGELGNSLKTTIESPDLPKLECKKMPIMEKDIQIIVPAIGGRNKASIDERYELLRYYSLTNDRLYTKRDIEAFLRKELCAYFGKDEYKRIQIKINIKGFPGQNHLQRGLYIEIDFEDSNNYQKAYEKHLDVILLQEIQSKSCISMPIKIILNNREENPQQII